jgi:hypothetical protein
VSLFARRLVGSPHSVRNSKSSRQHPDVVEVLHSAILQVEIDHRVNFLGNRSFHRICIEPYRHAAQEHGSAFSTSPGQSKNRWQIADTKTRVYLILVVSCGVPWCTNLLVDRVIQSRGRPMGYVQDVGVAGSNPVTPTTDFLRVFAPVLAHGSRYLGSRFQKRFLFSAQVNRSTIRLFLDVGIFPAPKLATRLSRTKRWACTTKSTVTRR